MQEITKESRPISVHLNHLCLTVPASSMGRSIGRMSTTFFKVLSGSGPKLGLASKFPATTVTQRSCGMIYRHISKAYQQIYGKFKLRTLRGGTINGALTISRYESSFGEGPWSCVLGLREAVHCQFFIVIQLDPSL